MPGDACEFKLSDDLPPMPVAHDGAGRMGSFGGTSLVSAYAVGRVVQLRDVSSRLFDAVGLTPRETECMKWAASGKTEWETSQILGISEHTAEKHLLNAKKKLGAVNRAHAVAEAIRRGLIP